MKNEEENTKNNFPPFLKTWQNIYALVAGTLFFLIVLFYVMTLYFA